MYLFINNLLEQKTKSALIQKNGQVIEKSLLNKKGRKGANILKGIDNILSSQNLALKDISGIIVVSGPGPFSTIRKVLSIGNTIGWCQDIPVVGVSSSDNLNEKGLIKQGVDKIKEKKGFHMALPFYGKEPNIS